MLSYPLTENAEIRALEPWNAEEFAQFIAEHREHLSRWLPWAAALTDTEGTQKWLQRYADDQAKDGGRIYGIWQDGKMVGGTLFRVFDARFKTCEIGVWLAPQAQGHGLITKAAQRMIGWAVRERGLNRVEWRVAVGNDRSIAGAKRLGMTLDGVLREAFPYNGTNYDIQVWSLLAKERPVGNRDSHC